MKNNPWKRAFLGAFLFLILVGEIGVGGQSGLFTPGGLVVFGLLYLTYFLLLDALVAEYSLSNVQIVLVNFALYAVLITGLLHGELRDYVVHPKNDLITTLIRIQSSVYPLFAFSILSRMAPRTSTALSLSKSLLAFGLFILVVTPIKHFGIYDVANTFSIAPGPAIVYSGLAVAAVVVALGRKSSQLQYRSQHFYQWSWALCCLGLIPFLPAFLLLLVVMIGVAAYYLCKAGFRDSSP